MRFGACNQAHSNVDTNLRISRQGNPYEPLHFQCGNASQGNCYVYLKLGTPKQGISHEIEDFETGNFHMTLGPFKQGSSNVHMQSGTSKQVFHMKFVWSNQGNSHVQLHM